MYGLAAAESETEELLEKKAELEALIQDAENARDKAERDQRELQSDVDEWKSKLDHARALGHDEEAAVLQKEWNELRAQEIAVHNQMDRSKLERDTKRVALKELFEVGAGYEARANRLWDLAGVSGAERKVAAFRFGALRDAPLLDPFAPVKKIEQLVIPELTVDYNFAQIGRVDRCVTCHKGIDKIKVNQATGEIIPLYTEENTENPVFRTHSRPELFVSSLSPHGASKMGCTVCHDGMGFGLTFNDAYHTPSTPEQEKEWEEKYHWHKGHSWDYPMLPLTYIEASCAKCHRDPVAADRLDQFGKEIPAAPKYNEGLRLFERSACYGCHQVDGWVVSGLDKWLDDIKDPDVRAEMAVHTIGKSGPGLTRVASKWTSKEAAWKWIWAPRDLRPNTNMPHFFGQPNNTGTDPITGIDYDLRTRTEVWGMVEYLWANSEEWGVKMPRLKGDPENGKALFGSAEKSVGCMACHSSPDFPNPDEDSDVFPDHGPDLGGMGSKTSLEWLYGWLMNPSHYWSETVMPDLRLTPQEAMDIAAYLMEGRKSDWEQQSVPQVSDAAIRTLAIEAAAVGTQPGMSFDAEVDAMTRDEQLRAVGKRAISRYMCYSCHDITGFERAERGGTQLGGSEGWGSKDVDRLDFGMMHDPGAVKQYPEWGAKFVPHRRPEWAFLKMKNPRVWDAGITKKPLEKLIMPNFGFSDAQAEAVVTFLLSLQRDEIPVSHRRMLDPVETQAEKMKWLARKYNCYACHTVHDEIRPDEDGEWLMDVQTHTIRPDGEGGWLSEKLSPRPRQVFATMPRGGDIRPWLTNGPDTWPPTLGGEERILGRNVGEGTKVQADWLFSFLHDPGKTVLRPWMSVRMPTFPLDQHELNAFTRGFAAHDRVGYPFEFTRVKDLDAGTKRAAKGLFDKLQCSSCHPAAGASSQAAAGLAPDLQYGWERLRADWVNLWLMNPAALQPGTKMPGFWKGQEDGSFNEPPGLEKEYFRRSGTEQMRRITDYVLGLGKPASGRSSD
jgi:mono/diheme cytochrome c family protein